MIDILYEDNHLIAINKKSGYLVQGDKTKDKPLSELVKDYIKIKYNKPGKVFCGVIHRIDRPVSGVVLFAKTSKSLARMNLLFKEKLVKKVYWALTEKNKINDYGELKNYLFKKEKINKSFICKKNFKNSQIAILNYKILKRLNNYFLMEITPVTGRHHQIRVQLSNINCPIKGDVKYNSKRPNKDKSICLHAKKISFIHPIKKINVVIDAPYPKNFSILN